MLFASAIHALPVLYERSCFRRTHSLHSAHFCFGRGQSSTPTAQEKVNVGCRLVQSIMQHLESHAEAFSYPGPF